MSDAVNPAEAAQWLRSAHAMRRPHWVCPVGGKAEERLTVEMLRADAWRLTAIAALLERQAEEIRMLKTMAGVAV